MIEKKFLFCTFRYDWNSWFCFDLLQKLSANHSRTRRRWIPLWRSLSFFFSVDRTYNHSKGLFFFFSLEFHSIDNKLINQTNQEFVTKYLTSFIADRSRIVPRLSYGYYAIVLLNRIYERKFVCFVDWLTDVVSARLRLLEDSFWLVAGLESRIKHFDPNRPNEILQLVPFFLPQSNRVSIFQKLIDQDRDEYE